MSTATHSITASTPQPDPSCSGRTWTTWGVCGLVAITWLLGWCFTDRDLQGDELGLFNPIYMVYSTGKATYPMHGQWDHMSVHPPVHYWVVGMLMRLGLSPVQAAGLHCWILLMAMLSLLLWSRLEARVKVCIPVACLMTLYFFGHYTLRPETAILLSWLAGLVALENSRTAQWRNGPLFLGGFFLAYASGLHYWSFLACLGAVPYLVLMLRGLGWKRGLWKASAILAGAAAFAIPYLAYFVIPSWSQIMELLGASKSTGRIDIAYASHLNIIGYLRRYHPNLSLMPSLILFSPTLVSGVIPAFFAFGILMLYRPARVLALASIPLPLFVACCIERKLGAWYLLPELHLWCLSLLLVAHTLCYHLTKVAMWWQRWRPVRRALASVAIAAYALALAVQMTKTQNLTSPPPDRFELYRAASRQLVPPNQLFLFSTNARWYTGGGTDLCFYTTWGQTWEEFARQLPTKQTTILFTDDWLANQRCAVPFPYWYLEGHLGLTGFTIGSHDFCSIFASPEAGTSIKGFVWNNSGPTLHRFHSDDHGDHVFVTLQTTQHEGVPRGLATRGLRLEDTRKSNLVLYVDLYPLDQYRRHEEKLRQLGTIRDAVVGRLEPVDITAFLAEHRRTDRPIRFHRSLAEGIVACFAECSVGQSVALQPFLGRPELTPLTDGTGYELRTNHSQDDWQTQTELEVEPHTPHWVSFELAIRRGGLYVHVYDPATKRYLHSFNRPGPQPCRKEAFVFNPGEANRVVLAIANNRPNGSPDRSEALLQNVRYSPISSADAKE